MFLGIKGTKITNGDNYLKITSLRYLPRWMVFLIDIVILMLSLLISYVTLQRLIELPVFYPAIYTFPLIIGVNIIFMLFLKTYSGIIRHSSFIDLLIIDF